MSSSLLEVDPRVIKALSPSEGVALMRRLLWAEASRLRIPRHKIEISSDITVPDGGIDAKVDAGEQSDSVLVPGPSHYQIKTGLSFKPWQPADVDDELFDGRPVSQDGLGEAVRQCLDGAGVYILVTLGHDLAANKKLNAEKQFQKRFAECGYPGARVMVLGVGQIIGILSLHPSLCLDVMGLGELPFFTIAAWAAMSDMLPSLELGEKQREFIGDLRRAMDSDDIGHIRVVGEPGVGKSRLVLEALRGREDFAANAMHVKQASDLQNSPLFGALLKPGRDHSLFLVVDECDNDDRSEIWRALKGRAAIKLITIDHGPENAGGDGMRTLSAPPLETAEIERILVSYIGIGIGLSKWAEWCGGSARVAHAIGANLKSHPRDILRPPDTVPIWQRFISGYGRESEDGRARTVLRHIALFEKFGHRKPVGHESQHIATLVSKVAPEITRGRFDEIITYYRQRKILQGDRTLRIVPTALRIFLWRDWWESYGDGADVAEMLKDMPDSLHGWFIRPFACAHNLPSAENAVKELLNPRAGLLAEDNFLSTERGSRFVLTLAEADPVSTLALLRTQIHAWPDSMVESLRGERQNLAWALERIAVWEGCFRHAALLLVRLARGDASSNSNNAAGIFKGMFAPIGAATQMPFEDRVGLLIEMLSSEDGVEKALALAACEMALNTRGYSRSGDVELQGMRPRIDCWHPRLWEELIGPWRSLLGTLMASRDGGVANWRSAVDAVLLEGCDNLIRSNVMQTNIVGTMERLALA